MSSPTRRYKYTYWYKDGTFYQGDVPPPEPSLWDYPLTHLLLSYKMTGTRIVQAYWHYFRSKL